MREFANLADAGHQLGRVLQPRIDGWVRPTLAPVLPNGVPVAVGIRQIVDLPWIPVPVLRSADGVEVMNPEAFAGCTAIVVDDGVETGTVARAVGPALRGGGVARLVLAVPVCSREALADLAHLYDEVITVVTPLVRRSLAWHYVDFDTIDEQEAHRLLEEHLS
jgi:predicted phosphoribosyltransferase